MKAMILAAGRGDRMRPLTDTTPKPLLQAGGKPIIQHTIEQLVSTQFTEIVINIAHLGQKIKDYLGNGEQFGATITYSDEGKTGLETAGGIINALPLLGDEPFLVVNGDIATDYDFSKLNKKTIKLAHLVLIPNPEHHPEGDFYLSSTGDIAEQGTPKLTFSGIGVYNPELFNKVTPGKIKLVTLLRQAISLNKVSGEKFDNFWMDIGTPERLNELDDYYHQQS
jgi:MurNAc alpha-1-phosphate uridylyltransferase